MNDNAARWLRFAQDDLQAAKALLKDGLFHLACFHAQQCSEKSFKAVLADEAKSPPRTHSLTDLLYLLPAAYPDEWKDALLDLEDYYLPTRYPDAIPGTLADGLPDKQESQEAVQAAQICLEWASAYLQEK
ncbi:MAG: HEPN domain-containing protein [Anaerolineales bacterium]